jgi:RNA polymerase primary sigma factor
LSQRLEQKHLRPAYQQEIADGLSLDLRKMQQIQAASRPLVSIVQPLYEDDVTLADTLSDPEAGDAEQSYVDDELVKELGEAMSLLTPREKDIVSRYYGLGSEETASLETIGQDINLSRERVRQIRNQALTKMRQFGRGSRLVDYLN